MKTIPYTPISGMELFGLRLAFKQHMPAILAWLRARERGAGVSPAIERNPAK